MNEITEGTMLVDIIRQDPKAFDFDDIKEVVPGRSSAGTSATLAQILGGFEFCGKDHVSGTAFFGRKPKVNGLDRLIDLINSPVDAPEEDGAAYMRAMIRRGCEVVAMLLYVQTQEGWRQATPEEVAEAFDLPELGQIRDRFSGLVVTETTSGNG